MRFPWIRIGVLSLVAFLGILYLQSENASSHGFSRAVHPVEFQAEKDLASNRLTGEIWQSSEDCRSCHEKVYDNWKGSRHRVSHTNELYKVSFRQEPMSWCLNCHSPLMEPGRDETNFDARFQSDDGISCITCHVREGKILTGSTPKKQQGIHDYKPIKEMQASEFCGNCHQFNFPTRESHAGKTPLEYSTLPMQNTLQEWKESSYYPEKTCQSCHLFPRTERSHLFPGGHNLEYLDRSFEVSIDRLSSDMVLVRLTGIRIGHHFPTGDHFRNLRLRLYHENGIILKEFVLEKHFVFHKDSSESRNPQESNRILKEDTSLGGNNTKNRTREWIWNYEGDRPIAYELEINYQSPTNHFLNTLPEKEMFQVFQKGKLFLPPVSDDKG
jgi:hypothetical protein